MDGRDWYLVQCKPGETLRALEHLENQQYECYLPLVMMEKIRQRKRLLCQEPLFPGYLFIHLDQLDDNWQPIRSTRGVTRLVGFGGLPLPVEDSLVMALKRRCNTMESKTSLEKGQMVRITEGPFCDLEAIFEAFDGDQRVVLLMNLLHQQQRLTLSASSICKI
ncbi:transcription/translation regulatory transformer protein RfaH [Nitrincola sp.]|uniref:transcription/translation regulatory transformer protein RfaH n=1 Tax=Nitrincola sp. TaxID=1926584 RepID=UPI003A95DDD5